jgi:hypothetical protein
MSGKELNAYDRIFIESIVEEINEMLFEKNKEDDTVPMLGVCGKDELPGDFAMWVHVFKTEDVKKKLGRE